MIHIQEKYLQELEKLLMETRTSHNTYNLVDEWTVLLKLTKQILFNSSENFYM